MKKISTSFAVLSALLLMSLLAWSTYRVGCGIASKDKQGYTLREAIDRG